MRTRIVLADDQLLFLQALEQYLESEFAVLATATNGFELVKQAGNLKPDVIIMEIALPVLNGIEAMAKIRCLAPETRILALTYHADTEYVKAALSAGARGYVTKTCGVAELVKAIAEVQAGRVYLTASMQHVLTIEDCSASIAPREASAKSLTPRQRQVLQLVAEGRRSTDIAGILGISCKTVEFHRKGIMGQVGLRSTGALTRYAIEQHVVS